MKKRYLGFGAIALLSACAGLEGHDEATASNRLELDNVFAPPDGVSLVVLDGKTDRERFADVVTRLQGTVLHALGARLAVAKLPAGADRVLADAGMVTHFERSVDPSEIAGATLDEQRFVRVFDNRYYAPSTPKALVSTMRRAPRLPGQPFEGAVKAPALHESLIGPVPVDRNTTPFASGTVVVSILLPESNGVAEPSTEDWTEDAIVETYQKVQTALETFQRTEPNANLRYVIHYESAPAHGGLPGTVDCDYEFGKHANYDDWAGETMATAPMLATLLGHPVTADQVWDASYEYLNGLRDRYHADGAFYVKVANNRNFTGGLRAHAYINGPWTTLSTDYGWETFMHEMGHIFGALDEYCPDQCQSTTAPQGYLGMTNANATLRPGGDGIDNGQGENLASLMIDNEPNNVQGYTRGAWGWLDTDGDGVIEVRDTFPKSALRAAVDGAKVRLQGTLTDVPATRFAGVGASFNAITSLEYRVTSRRGAPWLALPVTGTVHGVANVDLDLGSFPAGTHTVQVRAVNSVGNTEPAPQELTFTVASGGTNNAPRVRLAASSTVASTRSTIALDASTLDLEGDAVQVRFDTNGDGRFDTPFGTSTHATARFATAGIHTAMVEARDACGATSRATVEVLVEDGNALPKVTLAPVVTPVVGSGVVDSTYRVDSAVDPDGDPLEFNWTAELATTDGTFSMSSGFAAGNTSFPVELQTPRSLRTTSVDLTAGQPLPKMFLSKVVAVTPTLLAAAAGPVGVLLTDVSNPAAPRLVAHLDLQTEADRILVDGRRLYVFGPSLMSVVDVSNPNAPVEIAQARPFVATRSLTSDVASAIDDGVAGEGGVHEYYAGFGERIGSVAVDVTIDHPAPAELAITMVGPDGQSIVLRDHVAGPGGQRTYSFDASNTKALAAYAGALASGQWTIRVSDTVAGNAGTLVSSALTFHTSSKAAPVLADAWPVGVLQGRYVVLAGTGVQVVDVQSVRNARVVAQLTGTGTYGAGLVGSTLVGIGPLEVPPPKGRVAADVTTMTEVTGKPTVPQTRGLYAVDLARPRQPVVRRIDLDYTNGGQLFTMGSRFYLSPAPAGGKGIAPKGPGGASSTLIASASAFVAGGDFILGTLPINVHDAFGDDGTMWALGEDGTIVHLDVSNPKTVAVTEKLVRPQVYAMTQLSPGRVVFNEGFPTVRLANLDDVTTILSRVFRITLDARDGYGVATVSRAQHVIPYDHAPSIDAVAVTSGAATVGSEVTINVLSSDADRGPTTWDPFLFARADLDGDGIFEGNWSMMPARDPMTFSTTFATPGTYVLHFQVRDGFFGLASRDLTVQVK